MKARLALIRFLFLSLSFVSAEASDVVHHPVPHEPMFLNADLYDSFKSQLPLPPDLQSDMQRKDEKELFKLQGLRSQADCRQAKTEVFVSLKNFYGKPHGFLSERDVKILSDLFEQVRNDGDFFIQKMKKDFPRQRPFAYINGINPCVPKEFTGAYPSGHGTLSRLYALILSDFYPADKNRFEIRALEIGKHRILSGMHHPTDVESGRKLANLVYIELKKSKKYQTAFQYVRTKLRAR